MKKKKIVAFALAAGLLVGGTFVGTKALFTDSIENVGEISISTGDLDIELEDTEWVLDRNGAEHADGTQNVEDKEGNDQGTLVSNDITRTEAFANNLKPGDKLTKTVKIKNNGTLVADKLTLIRNEDDINEGLNHLKGLLTVSEEQPEKTSLLPGESTTATLTIYVNNVGGEHIKEGENVVDGNYNADDIENSTIALKNAWTLEATQQNESVK